MHSRNFLQVQILINIPVMICAASWNWEELDLRDVHYPDTFLWGSASSEYQISGAETLPNCQWAEWEKEHLLETSGSSIQGWQRFQEDILLLKEMGLNGYRFSVDWSAIEPEEGFFNQAAIDHYKEVCKALISYGITPMVTLHHFTHPIWFESKGAFEKQENIVYFVRFAKRVFFELSDEVHLWCTLNEPTVLSLMGYMLGEFPPGKSDILIADTVLQNLLYAHQSVYKELKRMPGGEKSQIGMVHQHLKFEPYHDWNPIESFPCYFLTEGLHQTVIDFFKKEPCFDFFGLNYYSRAVITMQLSFTDMLIPTCFPHEIMTDMPYAIYAEGFYEALLECSQFGKPIYVTENGIADAKDDRRELFIQRYLYALSKAIEDGADVRGYFYWTLIDNFEWAEGFSKKFGLYEWDCITQKRTLREGGKAYRRL